MYRKIRIILASIFFLGITLLLAGLGGLFGGFLDFMPKLQFLPAVLALNVGFIAIVLSLTFLLGRVYCSVICPLGVFQDIFIWLRGKLKIKGKKRKFKYHPENRWLRYGVFGLFVLALLAGFQVVVLLIAPYSLYGRFIHSLVHQYSWVITLVAVGTVVLIAVLAFFGGRFWCNNICPVGTALSFVSRFSVFRPVIDTDHCVSCKKCEKSCKAQCIDIKHHKIDYSRCVGCFDCLDQCKFDALHYAFAYRSPQKPKQSEEKDQPIQVDASRRAFLVSSALIGMTALEAGAQVDEARRRELARKAIALKYGKDRPPKVEPKRTLPVIPPGAESREDFYAHCTACHLCVASCPEKIIRPSLAFDHFLQPELTYAKKPCNPECNRCSEVCPTGAILPYMLEDKKKQRGGLAVVDLTSCYQCGKCARYCPYGAITLVAANPDKPRRRQPVVNPEVCVGCGACELACPVSPVSAIHIEGLDH